MTKFLFNFLDDFVLYLSINLFYFLFNFNLILIFYIILFYPICILFWFLVNSFSFFFISYSVVLISINFSFIFLEFYPLIPYVWTVLLRIPEFWVMIQLRKHESRGGKEPNPLYSSLLASLTIVYYEILALTRAGFLL